MTTTLEDELWNDFFTSKSSVTDETDETDETDNFKTDKK